MECESATMERYLKNQISRDLSRKIVLLSGPRQTGKTTLSKMLLPKFTYLNYDNAEHRLELLERSWDRNCDLVIFDELHKQKNWKSWLKGIYDTESIPPAIIVTGSARLDTHRKVGDSLAGRFFPFRLHPLDVKEIRNFLPEMDSQSVLERLLVCGGFPEPFLEGDQRFYKRWRRTHLDIILKQDLVDLENVQHISSIETLVQLLRKRVGSPISYNSLSRDLQCSDRSVKRWLQILENMYVIFRVSPYHRNIARSLLKSPKYYFYDTGQVLGDNGIKLENLTACALLKECHFLEDCEGSLLQLYFLQTKDGRELDFFVTVDEVPLIMVEVKWNDRTITRNFNHFRQYFTEVQQVQITGVSGREKSYPDGTELRNGCDWLADLSLSGD
jgi:predicted AAA+ superfamily ATPase